MSRHILNSRDGTRMTRIEDVHRFLQLNIIRENPVIRVIRVQKTDHKIQRNNQQDL
jgi:hypothetical protein